MRLTWATSPTPFVSLIRGVRRHLDVVRVRSDGRIFVSAELGWPINQEHFFDRPGSYFPTIVWSGANMTTLEPRKYRLDLQVIGKQVAFTKCKHQAEFNASI